LEAFGDRLVGGGGVKHYSLDLLQPARATVDRFRMTWAQHQRRECTFDGLQVKLSGYQRDIVSLLLIRRGEIIHLNELIEYIYPDPDLEPDWAAQCVDRSIWFLNRRVPGMIDRVWGRGFIIPRPA